jgi:hypothetical protein
VLWYCSPTVLVTIWWLLHLCIADVVNLKMRLKRTNLLWMVYIGKIWMWKHPWYCITTLSSLLALATLGDATQIGLLLFLDMSPKVAKASAVSCPCRWRQQHRYRVTFANVNKALHCSIKHKRKKGLKGLCLIIQERFEALGGFEVLLQNDVIRTFKELLQSTLSNFLPFVTE